MAKLEQNCYHYKQNGKLAKEIETKGWKKQKQEQKKACKVHEEMQFTVYKT